MSAPRPDRDGGDDLAPIESLGDGDPAADLERGDEDRQADREGDARSAG